MTSQLQVQAFSQDSLINVDQPLKFNHSLSTLTVGSRARFVAEMTRQLNVHSNLPLPEDADGRVAMVTGDYEYYHYGCDGLDDRGWGCGYRTLQTLCSWIRLQKQHLNKDVRQKEPSLREIQEALVAMGDKPPSLIGSKEWIGSYEVCICIDYFYDVPCKILHVSSGAELMSKTPDLWKHFEEIGSPIMMGGDTDASSKGIMGICSAGQQVYLLVVDPHFFGEPTFETLTSSSYLHWKPLDSFMENSFYNLCLPVFKEIR